MRGPYRKENLGGSPDERTVQKRKRTFVFFLVFLRTSRGVGVGVIALKKRSWVTDLMTDRGRATLNTQ